MSQCCKPQHVMKMSGQYLENVALKINVKVSSFPCLTTLIMFFLLSTTFTNYVKPYQVGGRNTVLAATLNGRLPYFTDRPTIIFGADVTHHQPGEDSSPSIAAVSCYALCY